MDIVEHALKAEFATGAREAADACSGYEKFSGLNQEPQKNDSSNKDSGNKQEIYVSNMPSYIKVYDGMNQKLIATESVQ